jgi:hypothetical protein
MPNEREKIDAELQMSDRGEKAATELKRVITVLNELEARIARRRTHYDCRAQIQTTGLVSASSALALVRPA